jgi:isoleucyl-tRNA synthetase
VVREVIRFIQEKRKSDGFEISDRISITYNANPQTHAAITAEHSFISSEVLATALTQDLTLDQGNNDLGIIVALRKA